ncbi:Protein fmp52-1, mitochondrial [Vanrija pseudolonga]|uniref:Protein fmp52-1, mitochondrial n=1 Tax=Vanrija pseudolonga TaxID=143232 RepID=A0AAF0Y6G5_9TREE|nr:Protein fmp52-1, mitochondrial [Vanrija pseudolonga]
MSPIALTLVGSTGLTGASALQHLLSSPTTFALTALSRRTDAHTPSNKGTSYTNRVVADLTTVAAAPEPLVASGGVYVTALGTTRAQAGGVKQQEAIDLDLNRDLATRAKKDGAATIIVVSSAGADANSYFAYPRIKGQLEEDVKGLGFERTVILRPATLLYSGDRAEKRTAEGWFVGLIKGARAIGLPTGALGIDIEDVGAAIAQLAANPPEGVSTLYDADLVKLAAEFRASQAAPEK